MFFRFLILGRRLDKKMYKPPVWVNKAPHQRNVKDFYLEVHKNKDVIDRIDLCDKPFYTIGVSFWVGLGFSWLLSWLFSLEIPKPNTPPPSPAEIPTSATSSPTTPPFPESTLP